MFLGSPPCSRGTRIDHCSFCGKNETTTGVLVRGRDGAICAGCLQAATGVTNGTALWLAKKRIQQRLAMRARWQANHWWKARGLPALDV
jgi:hypothetical protein